MINTANREEQIDALKWKLALAAKRKAELEQVLKTVPPDGYAAQEIRGELRDVAGLSVSVEHKLQQLLNPTVDQERLKRIAAERDRRVPGYLHNIERLNAEGDHRQARVWGLEIFAVADHVLKEFSA